MSKGFTKLFSSILTSTIWQEDAETCKVWITMFALADKDVIAKVGETGSLFNG